MSKNGKAERVTWWEWVTVGYAMLCCDSVMLCSSSGTLLA